jgi:hypothetical protein
MSSVKFTSSHLPETLAQAPEIIINNLERSTGNGKREAGIGSNLNASSWALVKDGMF